MSSDFVTDDTPFVNEEASPQVSPVKENIQGVLVAGWVLAFLLPFVGVIINIWLIKNSKLYSYKRSSVIAALSVSLFCSLSLLILLFAAIYNFSIAT